MFFFFRYLEATRAVHPVVVAAPAVASAIVARQKGHMVNFVVSNKVLWDAFCPWSIESDDDYREVS